MATVDRFVFVGETDINTRKARKIHASLRREGKVRRSFRKWARQEAKCQGVRSAQFVGKMKDVVKEAA